MIDNCRKERLLLVFTTLNWSGNFGRLSRRYDVESWVTVCCFIKTMHLPTPLPWNGCNSRMRLRIAQSTAVFTRSGSIWLPRVPIFERFASWTELWLWWRGHPHDKWLVRTARQTVLCGRCKLASTSMGKVCCAWRGLYWKNCKVNLTTVICVSDFLITYWSTLVFSEYWALNMEAKKPKTGYNRLAGSERVLKQERTVFPFCKANNNCWNRYKRSCWSCQRCRVLYTSHVCMVETHLVTATVTHSGDSIWHQVGGPSTSSICHFHQLRQQLEWHLLGSRCRRLQQLLQNQNYTHRLKKNLYRVIQATFESSLLIIVNFGGGGISWLKISVLTVVFLSDIVMLSWELMLLWLKSTR